MILHYYYFGTYEQKNDKLKKKIYQIYYHIKEQKWDKEENLAPLKNQILNQSIPFNLHEINEKRRTNVRNDNSIFEWQKSKLPGAYRLSNGASKISENRRSKAWFPCE